MRLIDADALHETLKTKQKWVVRCGDKHNEGYTYDQVHFAIDDAPTVKGRKGEWTTEEVAEILARVLVDECACNFNGIDEWLPSACKYADTECPTPKEKHGCWIQFLMQGGADMRGES